MHLKLILCLSWLALLCIPFWDAIGSTRASQLLQTVRVPSFSKPQIVVYVTDLEGSRQRFSQFMKNSEAFYLGFDKRFHLKKGYSFVFGGDAFDRYQGDLWVASELIRLKGESEFVTLIVGNRDINKIRLRPELSKEAMRRPPVRFSMVSEEIWNEKQVDTEIERLKFILRFTMGAPDAFEHRRKEISLLEGVELESITDEIVYENFLKTTSPSGLIFSFLQQGKLVHRIGNTLFVHGGVTSQNLGFVPGDSNYYHNIDEWILRLNSWYSDQLGSWAKYPEWCGVGPRPAEDLLDYPMPKPFENGKQESVVTGRNTDPFNNPVLPENSVIENLLSQGIVRVVIGHTPTGDVPVVVRTEDRKFEVIVGDNSYTFSENNASQLNLIPNSFSGEYDSVVMTGVARVDGREELPIQSAWTLRDHSLIGLKLKDEGDRVIGQPKNRPGLFVTFRMMQGFKNRYRVLTNQEVHSQILEGGPAEN